MYSQQGSWKYFYSVYTVRIVFGHTSVVERPVCGHPRVQSVTRIPKKTLFQDVIQQTTESPSGEILKTI